MIISTLLTIGNSASQRLILERFCLNQYLESFAFFWF